MQLCLAQEFGVWLDGAMKNLASHREGKVCILSVIGKTPFGVSSMKCDPLNGLLDKQAFLGAWSRNDSQCKIEVFYDSENQVVFLHLVGIHDLNIIERSIAADENKSFYQSLSNLEGENGRLLLFLFLLSHIVLVVEPCCRFDLAYTRLLRVLNIAREQTQDSICELLHQVQGISKDWSSTGRFCSARILFAFHRSPLRTDLGAIKRRELTQKLARSMEDQIYQIFRRSRVITNDSSASICAVPANQSFVYIFGLTEAPKDPIKELLEIVHKSAERLADTSSESIEVPTKTKKGEFGEDFCDFLMSHINLAHKEGFDDNVGKGQSPAYFELPKLKTFIRAASVLYKSFVTEFEKNKGLSELPQLLNVELEFSESRCKKVLPMALRAYEQDLPDFYPFAQHELKLAQAMQLLSSQSRGPLLKETMIELSGKCEEIWKNARQSCTAISLTGINCTNQIHVIPGQSPGDADLPIMTHNSKARYLSTCSCGYKQELRPDPFDLKEANYGFYERLEFSCCRVLEKYDFPIFQPSTPELTPIQKAMYEIDTEIDENEVKEEQSPENAAKMFRKLQIATQSPEEFKSEGPSTGGDFLLDRDNKLDLRPPALVTPDQSQTLETAQKEEVMPVVRTQEEEHGESGGSGSVISDMLEDEAFMTRKDSEDSEQEDKDSQRPGSKRVKKLPKPDEIESESDREDNEGAGELLTESQIHSSQIQTTAMPSDDDKIRDTYARLFTSDHEIKYKGQYLEGMPHSSAPLNVDPIYPSWSLLCLGSSSIYTHAHGLREMPNFSHGSHFLLPWDVSLKVDLEKWQQRMDVLMASAPTIGFRGRKTVKKSGDGSVNVKVFIGFEYECPRGHRFMLHTPDKMLKHSGPGGPKEGASTLVKSDLPLWFPCSCRTQPRVCGQLMCLHVVTPKAPVSITLNPRIVPELRSQLVFYQGNRGLLQLTWAKYYIMRFPYAYVGPDGPFYPPKEPISAGRLVKGMIGVVESEEANYGFYERLEFSCCRVLEKYDFPIFQPSTPELTPIQKAMYEIDTEIDENEVKEEQSPENAAKMFRKLQIATQSPEEFKSEGPSTGGDFLLDRDNKLDLRPPALVTPDQSQTLETAQKEEVMPVVRTQEEEHGESGGSGSVISDMLEDEAFMTRKDSEDSEQEDKDSQRPGSKRVKKLPKPDEIESESDREDNEGAGELLTESQIHSSQIQTTAMPSDDDKIRDTYARLFTSDHEIKYKGQYLEGMPHSSAPLNVDPIYPSWSLLCLGSSSIYTHAHGLREMPNFSHGSHFLLPWDVSLKVDLEKWQQRMDVLMASAPTIGFRGRKTVKKSGDGSVNVKVFIGFEYECPRGHRFMLHTPDKMLKHSGPGGPKEGASTLVKSDLPLWFPCSCRTQPRVCGQLMCLHVVTPKAPVSITLNPRIVPELRSQLVFYQGNRGLLQLTWAKYYIMRFPYAYVGPDGPFYPPKEPISAGRLVKGMIGVVESEV